MYLAKLKRFQAPRLAHDPIKQSNIPGVTHDYVTSHYNVYGDIYLFYCIMGQTWFTSLV